MYLAITIPVFCQLLPPCKQSLILSSWVRRGKGGSAWITSGKSLRAPHSKLSGLVNLVLSCQTGQFFKCEHPFINKMMIITEPAVASTWLLGLGWKLYCSNMLQYRSYSIHAESFSSTPKLSKRKKGFAGRVNCYSPYRLYRVYSASFSIRPPWEKKSVAVVEKLAFMRLWEFGEEW